MNTKYNRREIKVTLTNDEKIIFYPFGLMTAFEVGPHFSNVNDLFPGLTFIPQIAGADVEETQSYKSMLFILETMFKNSNKPEINRDKIENSDYICGMDLPALITAGYSQLGIDLDKLNKQLTSFEKEVIPALKSMEESIVPDEETTS